MIRLFHLPLSPFCRKVRLSLAEKKLQVELVEERFWERNTEFLRRNPAGKVPVLKVDDLIFSESGAICEYLEDVYPEPSLMPSDPLARHEVRRMVSWFDDKFHNEVTSKLLYERIYKKLSGRGDPVTENLRAGKQALRYHIDYLGWLLEHRNWVAGNIMTLADFAAAAHFSSLDYLHLPSGDNDSDVGYASDVDWNRHAAVKDWYAKIKSRPAFRGILTDLVPGFTRSPHYANLDF